MHGEKVKWAWYSSILTHMLVWLYAAAASIHELRVLAHFTWVQQQQQNLWDRLYTYSVQSTLMIIMVGTRKSFCLSVILYCKVCGMPLGIQKWFRLELELETNFWKVYCKALAVFQSRQKSLLAIAAGIFLMITLPKPNSCGFLLALTWQDFTTSSIAFTTRRRRRRRKKNLYNFFAGTYSLKCLSSKSS